MSSVFTFGFLSSGFRVQGSFLCQDMLVCVNIFIRGWVGFLFWFFEIFEFLFSLMLVKLLLICLHVCCCWTFIERKVAVGKPISNIHLEEFLLLYRWNGGDFLHRFILKDKFSSWGELWWNELGNPLIDFLFQEFRKSWLLLFCISHCLWH